MSATLPSATAAYITTVDEDHRVTVPANIPPGATVAVVVVSSPINGNYHGAVDDEATRKAHFSAVMEAIAAVANTPAPADQYTDKELDAIIEQARKALHNS